MNQVVLVFELGCLVFGVRARIVNEPSCRLGKRFVYSFNKQTSQV